MNTCTEPILLAFTPRKQKKKVRSFNGQCWLWSRKKWKEMNNETIYDSRRFIVLQTRSAFVRTNFRPK